jgi:hypothetical protein
LRKTLVYAILIIFLFNSMGYYFCFELDKYLIKKEMRLAIHQKPVHYFVFKINNADHDHELRRLSKHEIEYKNQLYDVVREITKGQARVFICVHDSKEEALNSGLKMAQGRKLQVAFLDNLTKITFPESHICVYNTTMSAISYPVISVSLRSPVLPTWSPPPEFS